MAPPRRVFWIGPASTAPFRVTAWACWSSKPPKPSCCGAACARRRPRCCRKCSRPTHLNNNTPHEETHRDESRAALAGTGGARLRGAAAVLCGPYRGHGGHRPRIHQLSALRGLDAAHHQRQRPLAPAVDALRQHLRPAQARRDRLGRRWLCEPRRRGLECHRKSLGAQRQGRGPGQQGPRTLLRKGQEFVLTLLLEQLLSKQRILEIYLNSVEWGEGVFGAEAAAQHYFRKSASRLSATEAARLAVMLPAPKRFEKTPGSAYLTGRTRTILARMGSAELP